MALKFSGGENVHHCSNQRRQSVVTYKQNVARPMKSETDDFLDQRFGFQAIEGLTQGAFLQNGKVFIRH